jgi:hypothetical protein
VLDDPKVQGLSAELFKTWVNVLCLAAEHRGALPPTPDIAFRLRIALAEAGRRIEALRKADLIDEADGKLTPHNWNARQHKGDVSTDRVRRFRERHGTN